MNELLLWLALMLVLALSAGISIRQSQGRRATDLRPKCGTSYAYSAELKIRPEILAAEPELFGKGFVAAPHYCLPGFWEVSVHHEQLANHPCQLDRRKGNK